MGKIYIVGVGLSPRQITLEALEVLRKVHTIYVDSYTSLYLDHGFEKLERLVGKKFKVLGRRDLEDLSGRALIDDACRGLDVALVVVGDPHIATTHAALVLEARRRGIEVEIIPGISILCAAMTYTGLMPYRFGRPVTLMYPRNGIVFTSTYDIIESNRRQNLHTFVFLELDAEKGIFMSASDAAKLLLELEETCRRNVLSKETKIIAIARAGSSNSCIVYDELGKIANMDLGPPPHSLIVPAPKLHPIEEEMLEYVSRCILY